MKDDGAILARASLAQLKRGVPPSSGASSIAVGFSSHIQELNRLLAGDLGRRWFAVLSDYGGGKSMFHALAREQALRAGYAVASLEVSRDNGALHEPQTHLEDVFRTLRSPLPRFANHQGIAEIARSWIEESAMEEIALAIDVMQAVLPASPAPRDRGEFLYLTNTIEAEHPLYSVSPRLAHRLVDYLSLRGITRGSSARFPALFRLQVVISWLRAIGHKGLFLFADEVDNVIRQIHGKAHPGCFRTLSWYCSGPSLEHLKVVFASTPEVVEMIGPSGIRELSQKVFEQKTAREEEFRGFRRWTRELSRDSPWALTCPSLTAAQRLRVYDKIAAVHQRAWGTMPQNPPGIDDLARMPEYYTTRRWVKTCVTLMDMNQQHLV
jgi:hypothetical protein